MKYPLLLVLFLLAQDLLALQGLTGLNSGPNPPKRKFLSFQYFRIDRKHIGGNVETQLNDDFEYLKLFKKGQRFAPDEPSSFSSLEFTFWQLELSKNMVLDISAGIYRNHIKGDLLLNEKVHFGRGNSQVGVSSTALLLSPEFFHGFTAGLSLQGGIGPQFTKWAVNNYTVSPESWGIRGWGLSGNMALRLNSPVFLKRCMIAAGAIYNLTYSRYGAFSGTNNNGGEFAAKGLHFTTASKRPVFSIMLKYGF